MIPLGKNFAYFLQLVGISCYENCTFSELNGRFVVIALTYRGHDNVGHRTSEVLLRNSVRDAPNYCYSCGQSKTAIFIVGEWELIGLN